MKNNISQLVKISAVLIVPVLMTACTGNSATPETSESTQQTTDTLPPTATDSMPIIKTPVTDPHGIVITPPINDSNVIIPDTKPKN